MKPLTIKICGLKTPEAVEAALDAGADMLGFVFFSPSPRHIGPQLARTLAAQMKGRAAKVALTVNASNEALAQIVDALKPDILQLHGKETPERVGVIRSRFGIPVMKALPVATRADLSPIRQYANVADRLLFDARPPHEATRPGGLGKTFDWTVLKGLKLNLPYMLSGGLSVANIAEALHTTRPPGVDVSSGVEHAAGEKDPHKIRAFIRAARAAHAGHAIAPLALSEDSIVSRESK